MPRKLFILAIFFLTPPIVLLTFCCLSVTILQQKLYNTVLWKTLSAIERSGALLVLRLSQSRPRILATALERRCSWSSGHRLLWRCLVWHYQAHSHFRAASGLEQHPQVPPSFNLRPSIFERRTISAIPTAAGATTRWLVHLMQPQHRPHRLHLLHLPHFPDFPRFPL